jgi:methylmalonyl-CoA mutase
MENRILSMEKSNLNIAEDFPTQTFEEWKTKVIADLKGKPFEKLSTETYEGIDLEPLYDFERNKNTLAEIPYPSQKNFRRGFVASGYSLRDWQIAQSFFETNPVSFNKMALDELNERQNAISTPLNGINGKIISDKLSLEINNYHDFKAAFQKIDFTKIPVHISLTSDYLKFYEYLTGFAKENYLSNENFKGSFTADPIRTFAAAGKIPQLKLNDDSLKFAEFVSEMASKFPPVKTIGIDASIYGNAGGSAVHELAFALATGVEYFNFLNEKIPTRTLAKKTKFTFSVGTNFFMEIAKLRAFRILWNSILEGFNISGKPQRILVEAKSSQFVQTIIEPYSNLLRATTEALA